MGRGVVKTLGSNQGSMQSNEYSFSISKNFEGNIESERFHMDIDSIVVLNNQVSRQQMGAMFLNIF